MNGKRCNFPPAETFSSFFKNKIHVIRRRWHLAAEFSFPRCVRKLVLFTFFDPNWTTCSPILLVLFSIFIGRDTFRCKNCSFLWASLLRCADSTFLFGPFQNWNSGPKQKKKVHSKIKEEREREREIYKIKEENGRNPISFLIGFPDRLFSALLFRSFHWFYFSFCSTERLIFPFYVFLFSISPPLRFQWREIRSSNSIRSARIAQRVISPRLDDSIWMFVGVKLFLILKEMTSAAFFYEN